MFVVVKFDLTNGQRISKNVIYYVCVMMKDRFLVELQSSVSTSRSLWRVGSHFLPTTNFGGKEEPKTNVDIKIMISPPIGLSLL
jgi:hypothetical protein